MLSRWNPYKEDNPLGFTITSNNQKKILVKACKWRPGDLELETAEGVSLERLP